jgi:radical SAM superfamily enzyme YgiQ (UPF0313 family)
MPSIYLINPRSDCPAYYGAEVFNQLGLPTAAFVADLAVATVAALAPSDFEVEICEENVAPAQLDCRADYIGITGKVSQRNRMLELAREYQRRGRTVILGGPYASLSSDVVRPHCDILVRGEIEPIASKLFDDLRSGRFRAEYLGTPADMSDTPIPRWELYPNERALQGSVQTARGCPFRCDFCDTIQYVGRKQRHKPPGRVLEELEVLYRLGYRNVFLADDNLTAHRPRARELLRALTEWNQQTATGRVHFSSQISVDAARHPDLLAHCAAAGLDQAFVGIETPNVDSLLESHKQQNLGADLVPSIEVFVEHGVEVIGGLMVGFDADSADIFRCQFEFAMQTPVASFSINALNAPPTTPLFERMEREGRLLSDAESAGPVTPWWTNMRPKQMSPSELEQGIRWLVEQLYRPANFEHRMLRFIELYPDIGPEPRAPGSPRRDVNLQGLSVVRALSRLGAQEQLMMNRLSAAARGKPRTQRHLFANLFRYMQIRSIYRNHEP